MYKYLEFWFKKKPKHTHTKNPLVTQNLIFLEAANAVSAFYPASKHRNIDPLGKENRMPQTYFIETLNQS